MEAGEETTKSLRKQHGKENVFWQPCDVTKDEEFERLWDETEAYFKGKVDILVNNAGVSPTFVPWRKVMAVNSVSCSFVWVEEEKDFARLLDATKVCFKGKVNIPVNKVGVRPTLIPWKKVMAVNSVSLKAS